MKPRTTTADYLQLASTATGPDLPDLLAQAAAAARHSGEWLSVAEAWVDTDRPAEVTRCLLAAQPLLDEHWDHRRAARLWLQLGDRDRAIEALAALATRYAAEPETSGTSWRLLAEGFAELQDTAAVQRCLASGRALVTEADDICSVARGYLELLGDGATARLLMEQAEATAAAAVGPDGAPDTHANWSVAGAWMSLFDDEARGLAQLTAGLARAADVSGCLTLAAAWASFGSEGGDHRSEIHECLAKARTLASSFDDWFAIAEATWQHDHDDAAIRSALQQAQPTATPVQSRKAARALRDWCGDHHAVEALGPWGLLPAELIPTGPSACGSHVDVGALLDWLRPRVHESALETMAAGDYHTETEPHLDALLHVHRTGRVPIPMEWNPLEVVSLYQWQEGDAVDHAARAFACTLKCLAELAPDALGPGGIEDTLAVLMESCCVLGEDALTHLSSLLAAFVSAPAHLDDTEVAFATLALLLVATRLDPHDPRLENVAALLLEREATLANNGYPHPEHGFLLGATFFAQRVQVWQELIRDTFAELPVAADRPAWTEVRRRLSTVV